MNLDQVGVDVLAAIEREFRHMTASLDQELAVVWPVRAGGVDRPVLASVGTDRQVSVLPARVFGYALRTGALGVILAHNHLSNAGPSRADEAVTRRLVAAGHVVGVSLLAHLVVEPGAVHNLVETEHVSWCDTLWVDAAGSGAPRSV